MTEAHAPGHHTAATAKPGANRRSDLLLRKLMISLFISGIVALAILWLFEARSGLLNDFCRVVYPLMIAVFVAGAAMLRRWPNTVAVARWLGFLATAAMLCSEFSTTILSNAPLLGNYPFISILIWFPLAYAIALLMLEPRHAPWAACTILVFIAAASGVRLIYYAPLSANDTALLVNVLAAHVVFVACLGGLVKLRQALVESDADSRHFLEQALTDPLTGLANRRHGLDMLRHAAVHHSAERPAAVILCDIDHFKEINDRYGHDAGDQIVLGVASILQNSTRAIDTVVRWGGDEFLIVVPHATRESLAELAERLRTRAAAAVRIDGAKDPVTPRLSVGVAARVIDETLGGWIRRADDALYQAKADGRNRCVFAPDGEAERPPSATSHPGEFQLAAEQAHSA